ncbi:hypothetical protein [Zhongshania sp.]|uniref:hypothetical protein n=1 Tax=Zhongshania sp. TaxID=1971902 RepID=UPI0035690A75
MFDIGDEIVLCNCDDDDLRNFGCHENIMVGGIYEITSINEEEGTCHLNVEHSGNVMMDWCGLLGGVKPAKVKSIIDDDSIYE